MSNWEGLTNQERDAVNTALGDNAGEWNARMRDAKAFVYKVQTGQPTIKQGTLEKVAPDVGRALGAFDSYGAKQAFDLSADVAKQLLDKTKLTDEQLFKLMLSDEGRDFLKTAKLSSTSGVQMLQDMDKLLVPRPPVDINAPTAARVTAETPQPYQVTNEIYTAPTQPATEDWVLPDMNTQKQEENDGWVLPPSTNEMGLTPQDIGNRPNPLYGNRPDIQPQ